MHDELQRKKSLLTEEEETLGENQVMNFSRSFLERQRTGGGETPVAEMSISQRMFAGLTQEAELDETAPVIQDKSKMGHFEKKAAKKSEAKQQKLYEAALAKREEQRRKDQEATDKYRQDTERVEELLRDPALHTYMAGIGQSISLDPNQYVGGEDDVINSGILVEMMKNPQGFGLAEHDSPQAAGYTVESLKELYRVHEQARYEKWRYRLLSPITGFYDGRGDDDSLPEQERDLARSRVELLERYTAVAERRMTLAGLTLQRALSSFINHKNFKLPEGGTEAHVKKRNYNLPQYEGLAEYYRQGQVDLANDELYQELGFKSTAMRNALVKQLGDAGSNLARLLLDEKSRTDLLTGAGGGQNFITEEAVRRFAQVVRSNPPPEDPTRLEAYNKAYEMLVVKTRALSTLTSALLTKRQLMALNPDVFADQLGQPYIKQMEKIEGDEKNLRDVEQEFAEMVERLRRASGGEAEPNPGGGEQ